ncbi:hypothetical protein HZC30_06500 [Candidatus Woesearchaeota archaeon]|nr:hypothetical protein [Candidatus Woesearchaeota archaeon]
MKKEIDKYGRLVYKFSHSVGRGGDVYIHKTLVGKIIENKQGLRNYLGAISKKHDLIDPTIKIYDTIFFLFFHTPKSLAPAVLIESIGKNLSLFSEWDEKYVWTGVYDLQEKFLRKDLEKWRLDYDEG